MSTVELRAPKNISPLIRAGRWTFFLVGVAYGYNKLNRLSAYDAPLRKAEIEKRTQDHIRQVKEKEILEKENMKQLAKAAGVIVKD